MEILSTRKTRILATLVVRDEEDIISHTIEHNIEQGIKDILVTNNSSKDQTKNILSKYPEIKEIYDSDDMSHNQEIHTTRMARLACNFNPDWIVHLDADEFWCGLGDLNAENIPHETVWATNVFIHPPTQEILPGKLKMHRMKYYIDFRGKSKEYKIIHRPNPEIIINHGNHSTNSKTCGYTAKVYRHHYPIRAYDQFEKKVVQGTTALQSRGFSCQRWDKWFSYYENNRLKEIYDLLVTSWTEMTKTGINEPKLKKILDTCYNVNLETSDILFNELKISGMKPLIKQWTPKSNFFLG